MDSTAENFPAEFADDHDDAQTSTAEYRRPGRRTGCLRRGRPGGAGFGTFWRVFGAVAEADAAMRRTAFPARIVRFETKWQITIVAAPCPSAR